MKNIDPSGLSAPAPGLYTWPPLPFSKIFFSKTAWPIKVKFYVEPPWESGKKVYIKDPGHMTKMAATPIYDKNLKIFLSHLLLARCDIGVQLSVRPSVHPQFASSLENLRRVWE